MKMGINLHIGDDVQGIGSISFTDGRWQININRRIYEQLDSRSRDVVIYHEFFHFLRGDPIQVASKKLDNKLWNIAADVIINEFWRGSTIVEQMGMNWDSLRSMLGVTEVELPTTKDTMHLYLCLRRYLNDKMREFLENYQVAKELSPEELEAAGREWVKAMVRLRGLYSNPETALDEDVLEQLRRIDEMQNAGVGSGGDPNKRYALPPPKPPRWYSEWLAWYRQLVSSIYRVSSTRKVQRSYRKEGLVQGTMGLFYKPIQKDVAVFIDVSGSMDLWRMNVLADSLYLLQKYGIELYVFADECKKVDRFDSYPDVGSGTAWRPVEAVIKQFPPTKSIVVISDFYFADVNEPSSLPENALKIICR